jgi:hypothetical protein
MSNVKTMAGPGRARRWLRSLGLLFVLALLIAALAWRGLQSIDLGQVQIMVDGDDLTQGAGLAGLRPGQQVLVVLLIAAACFAMLLAVPLLMLAVAVFVLPVLLLALGLPLIVVLSVAALLAAPLVLLGLLGRWVIRALLATAEHDNRAPASATMAG